MKAVLKQTLGVSVATMIGVSVGAAITGMHMADQLQTLTNAPAPVIEQPTAQPAKLTMWTQPQSIQPVFSDGELVIYEEQGGTLLIYRDDQGGLAVTLEGENGAINLVRKNGKIVATEAPTVFTNL